MPVQSVDAVDPARLRYPEHLPVVERRDDIAAAIRDHQVVVVAGETGSGKTTQLPKICLELGRGPATGVDRPHPAAADRRALRRRADRRGARRRARRRRRLPGALHRPEQRRDTLVKVMTDGILLAEMQRDRDLRRYDTIIIDEAHERSLNIDFILGYLKQLLPRRPDLKVVITSATIDPQRFAEHFADRRARRGSRRRSSRSPGRTYPVEIRYRPLVELPRPAGRRRRARPGDRASSRPSRSCGPSGTPGTSQRHPRRSSPASGRSATPPTR